MKTIDTLIQDIYSLVKRRDGWFTDALRDALSQDIGLRLQGKFTETERRKTLRLSRIGPQCPCALWYSVHHPELAEEFPAWVEIKFAYGHILEAFIIALAKEAGHEVTGEQDELSLDGIIGHRDCVIDGYTVDVKSANSRAFGDIKHYASSPFITGYLDQLASYTIAAKDDPLVKYKDVAYILAVDQEMGHLCLRKHEVDNVQEQGLRARVQKYRRIVAEANPPPCECRTIPQGASGNLQLDLKARYSPYKYCCHPSLRTFLYASGPIYLTKVERKPDVPEIDRYGKIVYTM